MKHTVRVSANFPELPAAHSHISASGSGSTKKAAISDGVRNILANPKLKGKRYTNFTLNVFILGVEDSDSGSDQHSEVSDNDLD